MKEQQRVAIEHARQRKEQEELERKRQREAAAQAKLEKLDAGKNSQLRVQTHDNSVRDQAGMYSTCATLCLGLYLFILHLVVK